VLAFFVVVRWGIIAVAAAYVLRAYVLIPLDLVALRNLIDVSPRRYFGNLAPAVSSSAIMATAVIGVQQLALGSTSELLMSVAVGVAAYSASLYLIAPLLVRELWSKLTIMLSRETA
jgi:PST family polysaccharide transporter